MQLDEVLRHVNKNRELNEEVQQLDEYSQGALTAYTKDMSVRKLLLKIGAGSTAVAYGAVLLTSGAPLAAGSLAVLGVLTGVAGLHTIGIALSKMANSNGADHPEYKELVDLLAKTLVSIKIAQWREKGMSLADQRTVLKLEKAGNKDKYLEYASSRIAQRQGPFSNADTTDIKKMYKLLLELGERYQDVDLMKRSKVDSFNTTRTDTGVAYKINTKSQWGDSPDNVQDASVEILTDIHRLWKRAVRPYVKQFLGTAVVAKFEELLTK